MKKESLTLEIINAKLTAFRERLEAGEKITSREQEEMHSLINKGLEFVKESIKNDDEKLEMLRAALESTNDDEEEDEEEEAEINIRITKKGFSTEINGFSLPEVLGNLELVKQAIIKEHN
jgi:hypothetical protein